MLRIGSSIDAAAISKLAMLANVVSTTGKAKPNNAFLRSNKVNVANSERSRSRDTHRNKSIDSLGMSRTWLDVYIWVPSFWGRHVPVVAFSDQHAEMIGQSARKTHNTYLNLTV